MEAYLQTTLIWIVVLLELVGIGSAWMARASEGTRCQVACQFGFLACLAIVGLATVLSAKFDAGHWYLSAATLAIMVVAATCEFRNPQAGPSMHASTDP